MKKSYTTGELASLCGVSKRTVQYYDLKNIVKPSNVSENGRRNYTEEDAKKFQLVCLYKNLGLTLHEIKNIMKSDNPYELLISSLKKQQHKIDEEMFNLINQKDKIAVVLNEISMYKTISIKNEEELSQLILQKKSFERSNKATYFLLVFYMIILFLSFIIDSLFEHRYIAFVILINIGLLLALIVFHWKHNAYVCPNCHYKFEIGLWKDMFTLNNGKKGKYLKCPYCHKRSWIVETYQDKN